MLTLKPSLPRGSRMGIGLGAAALLAVGSNHACAGGLASVATSTGVVVALALLALVGAWPAHAPVTVLSGGIGLLSVALTLVWLWQTRRVVPGRALASHRRAGRVSRPWLPAVDPQPLLAEMRLHFVRLQAAWDQAEIETLRQLTTPDMLEELCLARPEEAEGSGRQCTEVVTLQAELFGFEQLPTLQLASVEFSGLIRESADQGAVPFRELWLLSKSTQAGSHWRLARHQALL